MTAPKTQVELGTFGIQGLFRNPNVTTEFVDELIENIPDRLPLKFLLGVASCPKTNPEQLRRFWSSFSSDDFKLNASSNSATPPDLLHELFEHAASKDTPFLLRLLSNPSLPKVLLKPFLETKATNRNKLFRAVTPEFYSKHLIWTYVARNSSFTSAEQMSLVKNLPQPQDLYLNDALGPEAFNHLWSLGVWREAIFFKTSMCSKRQLLDALKFALEAGGSWWVFEDSRCSKAAIRKGRISQDGDIRAAAWGNERLEVNWESLVSVDDKMKTSGLARRGDLPEVNSWGLYSHGVTDVLKNPIAPISLLVSVIEDSNVDDVDRSYALQNPQIELSYLRDLLGLSIGKNSVAKTPVGQKDCGFRLLKQKLAERGWHVAWTTQAQENHVWEDLPTCHPDGPFEGLKIDEDKVLVALTGFASDYVERDLPQFESLDFEEQDDILQWFDDIGIALLRDGSSRIEELMREPVASRLSAPTPEAWGEGWFLYSTTEQGYENLGEVRALLEECGCREGALQHPYVDCESEMHIIWSEPTK